MSFATEVRNELARIMPEKTCCQKAELSALLTLRAELEQGKDGRTYLINTVENPSPARKIYRLLKEAYGLHSTVRIKEKRRFRKSKIYLVETPLCDGADILIDLGLSSLDSDSQISSHVNWSLLKKSCCKRAYLRGVFLSRGFINRPEGEYHLEIVLNDAQLINDVQKLMQKLGLKARASGRKNSLLLYIKESEKIVDFLRIVGASKALLDFENVRIVKAMRNQVNRQVNCETANLEKTVDASVRQVETIEKLFNQMGHQIPSHLRELAILRIEHPDSTMKELGAILNPPLTKSGVAYRMKKLENMAKALIDEDNG